MNPETTVCMPQSLRTAGTYWSDPVAVAGTGATLAKGLGIMDAEDQANPNLSLVFAVERLVEGQSQYTDASDGWKGNTPDPKAGGLTLPELELGVDGTIASVRLRVELAQDMSFGGQITLS